MKVIIAGSRYFNDYDFLKKECDKALAKHSDGLPNHIEFTIVSGGAVGADALGEKYAREKGYKLIVFPANWEQYGKAAGPIRNAKMAEYADMLIAFWDGESKGTKNMINLAESKKLKEVIVIPLKKE